MGSMQLLRHLHKRPVWLLSLVSRGVLWISRCNTAVEGNGTAGWSWAKVHTVT